jgi:GR25 family glycosyltransferase involved in LPS biosynthesis
MKTIAISLERRKDRRDRLESHLEEVGFNEVIYFPAYDGGLMPANKIIPPNRPYFSFKDEMGMPSDRFNKFQIGCTLSHVGAIKLAKALKLPMVLIVEDDVEFLKDIRFNINQLWREIPDDWEMIYLGGAIRNWAQRPTRKISDHVISPGFCDGLQAYILNEKGYDKVANEMLKFRTTNDDSVNDARFDSKNPLIAYMIEPKSAFQISDFSELDRKVVNRKDLR